MTDFADNTLDPMTARVIAGIEQMIDIELARIIGKRTLPSVVADVASTVKRMRQTLVMVSQRLPEHGLPDTEELAVQMSDGSASAGAHIYLSDLDEALGLMLMRVFERITDREDGRVLKVEARREAKRRAAKAAG